MTESSGKIATESSAGASTNRFAVGVAALLGLAFVGIGLWQFFAPSSFFDAMAPWEPYNEHFLRDLGAFTIGLGAILGLAALMPDRGALRPALTGAAIGAVFHVASHVMDGDVDPGLLLIALLLLVAAGLTWRDRV